MFEKGVNMLVAIYIGSLIMQMMVMCLATLSFVDSLKLSAALSFFIVATTALLTYHMDSI